MRIQIQLRAWLLVLLLSFVAAPWQHAAAKTGAPVVAALDSIGLTVRAGKFGFISPGAVDLSDAQTGFHTGLSVRDPDGHASRILQK